MKKLLFIFLLSIFSSSAFSQTFIKGEIVDEADKTKLSNATIMLIQARDSILVDFTRSGENGKFQLGKPDTGSYLLIVSYPKFGDYYTQIDGDKQDSEIGQIGLTSVANLLEEVLVTGKIPVVIKGDTIEYDASSFTVEKNAKVEDLLKVLPGISVDASGKITAQGKTVEKVLVDGEEFFGDDPTLVTRNIRSDMVDKVQVYEKKSEEAERTGVDDGQRIQTIDVKLKEDAKKGMFGKAEAAGGNDNYYLGKLALNKFKGSQKIGAFVLGANDGTINLNWEEEEKFGMSSMNMEMSDDGGMHFYGNWDEFSNWDGRGRPGALSTGISFNDGWKEGKHKLNFSYKYGQISNNVEEQTISQNNLSASNQLNSENISNRESDVRKHRFNSKYDWKLDSLTTLTVKLSGSKGKLQVDNYINAKTTDENFVSLNDNERLQSTDSENSNFTYDGYLTRRFKKVGRSLSLRIAGNVSDDVGDVFLKSRTNFYADDLLDTLDQYKDIQSTSNNLRTSVAYTEPITKKLNSSISYEYNNSKSHSLNNSYNKDASERYTVFDEEFSNDFDYNTVRNAVNLSFGYKAEKFEANLTNNLRNDNMFQRNNYEDLEVGRDFFTYNPNARLRYNITKNKSIGVNYNHSNSLPSLSQIQPLRQNTDPLNIIVGNESLTPALNDSYSVYFYSYNMMKGTDLYANGSFRQTRNSIQQNVEIDGAGVRTVFYDNLEDYVANNANAWIGGGFDLIKKYKIKARIGGDGSYSNYYNYINAELNENTNFNYSLDFGITKNTTKNIDFNVSFVPGWRTINTSLNPERNSSGFTYNSTVWYKWHLPMKFSLYGDLSYNYEAPTKAFDEKFERVLFKPGISRKFLKDESLVVDFYVNDIFNQNVGFRRYQSGNSITQNTYNTISRYFMLKVSWDFTTMNGGKE